MATTITYWVVDPYDTCNDTQCSARDDFDVVRVELDDGQQHFYTKGEWKILRQIIVRDLLQENAEAGFVDMRGQLESGLE